MEAFASTNGRNSHEVSPYAVTSVAALMVADRGPSSMSAISPK